MQRKVYHMPYIQNPYTGKLDYYLRDANNPHAVYKLDSIYDAGNSGASKEIDFSYGQYQKLTLTDDCVISFKDLATDNMGCGNFTLEVIQGGSGGYTLTLASGIRAPSGTAAIPVSSSFGATDILVCTYNGTYFSVGIAMADVQVI
jgi:hypothetical protein